MIQTEAERRGGANGGSRSLDHAWRARGIRSVNYEVRPFVTNVATLKANAPWRPYKPVYSVRYEDYLKARGIL